MSSSARILFFSFYVQQRLSSILAVDFFCRHLVCLAKFSFFTSDITSRFRIFWKNLFLNSQRLPHENFLLLRYMSNKDCLLDLQLINFANIGLLKEARLFLQLRGDVTSIFRTFWKNFFPHLPAPFSTINVFS